MKKIVALLTLFFILTVAPFAAATQSISLNAAAGPMAGTSYVGLGALCKLFSAAFPQANVNIIPGSDVSNPLRIQNKEVDIACETVCYGAVAKVGMEPFKKPVTNVRSLANIRNKALLNIVVRADTGIASLQQIKDNKMAVRIGPGPRGSVSRGVVEWVLQEYGITFKDITDWGGKVYNNNFNDIADMAKDGQVDMVVWLGPGEAWFLTELGVNVPLRWLAINSEAAEALSKKYMLYTSSFPATMHKGMMDRETLTVGSSMSLIVREDMSEEIAYQLTKLFSENREAIITACPQWDSFEPAKAWEGMPYPLHLGAARYYREKGYMQ